MPMIFKTCGACGEKNSIPVGKARAFGKREHKCKCGTVLFQYTMALVVEPSGTFKAHS
jgi:hypothetical protein